MPPGRVIRAQIPFVRIESGRPAVSAKKNLTARLAVQQLQDARAAGAGERRDVVQRTAGTRSVSLRGRRARGIRTDPETLKVAKKQVRADRQRRIVGRRARTGESREEPVHASWRSCDGRSGKRAAAISSGYRGRSSPACAGPSLQARRNASAAPMWSKRGVKDLFGGGGRRRRGADGYSKTPPRQPH